MVHLQLTEDETEERTRVKDDKNEPSRASFFEERADWRSPSNGGVYMCWSSGLGPHGASRAPRAHLTFSDRIRWRVRLVYGPLI